MTGCFYPISLCAAVNVASCMMQKSQTKMLFWWRCMYNKTGMKLTQNAVMFIFHEVWYILEILC